MNRVLHFLLFRSRLLIIVLLSVLIITVMKPSILERLFIYFPTKTVEADPSQVGLEYEEVFVTTEDGARLHAWFVPYREARFTFLIFHGNAGNIGHRIPWLEMLAPLGINVLMFDYRGYGKSTGSPFEQGLYRDARAMYQWWSRERAVNREKLVLVGESLGGAVAVDLAAGVPVSGLVLQSTFTTAWDMAKIMLPIGLLQPLARVRFDSAVKIQKLTCPKLFIHGDRDEIVPLRLGRKLYELAPGPKEFYEVPGAGHNNLLWVAGPEYGERLKSFIARIATESGPR